MKVLDPGHVYELDWLDGKPAYCGFTHNSYAVDGSLRESRLIFVKREGEKYPGNVGHHPGTQIQEVLRALIDRVKYVDNQIPDDRNETVLGFLRLAFFNLEHRAAERHGREINIDIIPTIELQSYCKKCGHIGCEGTCHA